MSSNLRTLADNIKRAKMENPEAYLRFRIMRDWPLGQESMKILSVKIKHLTTDFVTQARNLVVEVPNRQILTFNFARSGDSSFGTNRAISAFDIEDLVYQALLMEAHKNDFKITLRITDLNKKDLSEQNLRETTLEQQEIGAFYLSWPSQRFLFISYSIPTPGDWLRAKSPTTKLAIKTFMKKDYQHEPTIIIGNSEDVISSEKTSVQLKNADSLMNEVKELVESEAPTSIRPIDSLEGATRQFHSQIMPVVQDFYPQQPAESSHLQAPQYYPTPLPNIHPEPQFDAQPYSVPHTNQVPNIPVPIPSERIRTSRPPITFSRNDEPTNVNRPIPTPKVSPADQQAAMNELFNKSNFNKKEFLIKTGMVTLCLSILAVIVTAKITQRNTQDNSAKSDNSTTTSTLTATAISKPSAEPTLAIPVTTPTENSAQPLAENSAEPVTSSSAVATAANTVPPAVPTYLRPSQIPTKLNPDDPYSENPMPTPIKSSTQKPPSKSGIIRDVPF